MLNIADLKPGMVVSVRDTLWSYPRCLVVTSHSLDGDYWVRPFFDDDVVEVVE